MKKWLLLIICIFLFTGCKVEYNVLINDNLEIKESVKMEGTEELFSAYYKTLRINVIKDILESNDNEQILKENNYQYEIIDDNSPYVLGNKTYSNVNDYINESIFFEQYFDNVSLKEENGIISIIATDFKPNSPQDLSRFDIKNCVIKITSLYKVIEHNASLVDENSNVYTWNINDDTEDLEIIFKYNTNKKFRYIDSNLLKILSIIMLVTVILWSMVFFRKKK